MTFPTRDILSRHCIPDHGMCWWINNMFTNSFEKKWYHTYWAFDLHGTVIRPNRSKTLATVEYYPHAKECLQILTKRDDVIMFTYTATYPEQLENYISQFKEDGIAFDFINENPEISEAKGHFGFFKSKPYFNVLFEDKAGFNPEVEWRYVERLLKMYEERDMLPDRKWR